jgi:hypothetical protein
MEPAVAKVGRNAPCPCGSGKKYKRCHANDERSAQPGPGITNPAVRQPDLRLTNPAQTTAELRFGGMPGMQQFLTMVPVYADSNDPRYRTGPQGAPGEYELEFTFCRPGIPLQPESSVSFGAGLKGDSHLAITRTAHQAIDASAAALQVEVVIEGWRLQFIASPNERGFMAKIAGRVSATGFIEALRNGFKALAPTISNWALQLDIPMMVYQVDLHEVASGARRITFTPPFYTVPLVLPAGVGLTGEFRGYSSVYREALNSNSPVYQLLCFFKIAESIIARRARLGEEARTTGKTFSRPQERFPEEQAALKAWLNALFRVRPEWDDISLSAFLQPAVAGKKFSAVIENQLRPMRVNIAHALFETGELGLSVDDYLNVESLLNWLPVAKCMIRRMLKNEFADQFLTGIPDP